MKQSRARLITSTWSRLSPIWIAVAIVATLRLGLSLLGAAVATTDVPGPCHFEEARNGWQTLPEQLREGPAFVLAGIWERWDACWYMKIATFGYEPGAHSVAFFPLFPALVMAVGTLGGLPYPAAGLVVAAASSIVATLGILLIVRDTHGAAMARWATTLLAIFPSAFFLLAPFSESTFLAAASWTLLLARRRHWKLAIVAALLAGLARPQGLLLAIPLAWEAWRAARDRPGPDRPALLASSLAVLAPVAAFAAFSLAAAAIAGESPIDAQALWGGSEFHPPWAVVASSVAWVVERGDVLQALNLAALLGAAALLVMGARRMPLVYSLYAWPPLLLVATRLQPTPLTSTTRYVLVLFPIFVVAAMLTERPALRWAWVTASIVGLGILATWFVQGSFVA